MWAIPAHLVYNRYTSSPSLLLPEVFRGAVRAQRSSVFEPEEEDDISQLKVLQQKFLGNKLKGYLKRPKSSYIRFG
ncbi:hypothetical protein AAVH_26915 [Aphelenchoides avenae]|nr:hypothetical protein AAVH_26915 [Aphelenchus avenae]